MNYKMLSRYTIRYDSYNIERQTATFWQTDSDNTFENENQAGLKIEKLTTDNIAVKQIHLLVLTHNYSLMRVSCT